MASRHVSFVIPTMNEQETVETLVSQINQVCTEHSLQPQIIFVDDGSTDNTWAAIERIVQSDETVEAIRFRRNFGKAAALAAGFEAARGEIVLTMDADLQDDPKEIPKFLALLDDGLDVISGWKRVRHDPWHKVLPSRVFNWLVSRATGVKLNDHNCGFKAYRCEVFDEVKLYGELHRFVPVLAASHGWKVGEVEVEHHPREFGQSKYGVSRIVKGFLDLLTIYFLTGFGRRPLHFVGSIGLLCFTLGGLGMIYLSSMWVLTRAWYESADQHLHLHSTAIFFYCILAVLLGAQLLLAGLLAELFVSLTRDTNTPFSIAQRIGQRVGQPVGQPVDGQIDQPIAQSGPDNDSAVQQEN